MYIMYQKNVKGCKNRDISMFYFYSKYIIQTEQIINVENCRKYYVHTHTV